jgi:hypothetical protein
MADEMSCAVCGGQLVQPARGRPRLFCSGACRQRAYELRRWATQSAPGFAADWRSIGDEATAARILEEARLIQSGNYRGRKA